MSPDQTRIYIDSIEGPEPLPAHIPPIPFSLSHSLSLGLLGQRQDAERWTPVERNSAVISPSPYLPLVTSAWIRLEHIRLTECHCFSGDVYSACTYVPTYTATLHKPVLPPGCELLVCVCVSAFVVSPTTPYQLASLEERGKKLPLDQKQPCRPSPHRSPSPLLSLPRERGPITYARTSFTV